MDSLITNIRFYSTISESIYGTMNRGKSYFQLKLTYGQLARIKPLSDADYNAVSSQENNIHTQSFNNMALTVAKTDTQFGSEVQGRLLSISCQNLFYGLSDRADDF